MEVYKHFEIEGGVESIKKFMDCINKLLGNEWARDKKVEDDYMSLPSSDIKQVFCIKCPKTKDYPSARLWLFQKSNSASIGNIVPIEINKLTTKEYNTILDTFSKQFAEHAIEFSGVSIMPSKENKDIKDLAGRTPAKLLTTFSRLANKSTGSAHPCDAARWIQFLISTHNNDSKLKAWDLRRWLIEEEKWSEEEASKLAIEYDFARDLLRSYDNSKVKNRI